MRRVRHVGTIQCIRVRKHGQGLIERDPVFAEVGNSLTGVPLEHNSVYTKRRPVVRADCRTNAGLTMSDWSFRLVT